jgi:hypothetical protein
MYTSSTGYITGQGFPQNTIIWYESILNLELLPNATGGTVGIDATQPPALSEYFPSIESLLNTAKSFLGSAAVMDAAEGLLSVTGHTTLSRGLAGARKMSRFGNGSHSRRVASLVAGASNAASSRASTVVIEEMKDERIPASARSGRFF